MEKAQMRHSLKRAAAVKIAVMAMAGFFLCGCSAVTDDMLEARKHGIALMESGDYEGAIQEFEALIDNAKKVTGFEIDILKYRAEAEFGLGDYEAAAYTYGILNQVDEKKAEYCYFGALSLAKGQETERAQAFFEEGKALDEKGEAAGYTEAAMALGEAFAKAGDEDSAEAIYDGLLQSGHGTTELYNRLMMAEMEAGNYEKALSLAAEGKNLTDGLSMRELKFNEAVCREYLGEYETALSLFQAYVAEFGEDERAAHEIAFLVTR